MIVSAGEISDDPVESNCIVVVVALAPSVPATPPEQARKRDGHFFLIGGQWRKTPVQMKLAPAPDLLKICGHLTDLDTILYLEDSMERPGSFVIRDWREGVLYV